MHCIGEYNDSRVYWNHVVSGSCYVGHGKAVSGRKQDIARHAKKNEINPTPFNTHNSFFKYIAYYNIKQVNITKFKAYRILLQHSAI